jgi:FkbM family methyltransferase
MTILDLGANIGYYTLLFARGVQDFGRVYAFEPESFNFRLLTANVRGNGYTNVTLVRKAVCDLDGDVTLYRGVCSGEHSICFDNVLRHAGSEVVRATTLDRFTEHLDGVHMIKMDIQGAEGKAIRGGERLLTEQHPILFLEISPHLLRFVGDDFRDVIELLQSWGYILRLIDESRNRLEAIDFHNIETRCKFVNNCVNVVAKNADHDRWRT